MKEDSRDQLLILMKIPFPSSRAVRSQLVLAFIQITRYSFSTRGYVQRETKPQNYFRAPLANRTRDTRREKLVVQKEQPMMKFFFF